jgi:hypothetical protein
MKYKNIIKLRLPKIQLLAVVPSQLKFSIVKDHDEPTILLFETLFYMWECLNMGTELPTKVMLGQTLVLMQMTFLNNVRKLGRLVLYRTSSFKYVYLIWKPFPFHIKYRSSCVSFINQNIKYIQDYNFTRCFVCARNLVFHYKRRT